MAPKRPIPYLGGPAVDAMNRAFGLRMGKPEPRLNRRPQRKSDHRFKQRAPGGNSNLPAQYKVVKELGNKGGGCNDGILIVHSRQSNKIYIEKKIPANWAGCGLAKAEVNFLKQLRGHSHIVEMVNHVIEASVASIFFEYCEWGSMDDLIERHYDAHQWISEEWLWKAFKQMASAIDYCHCGPSQQIHDDPAWYTILHLDLKPQNVLLKMGPGSTPDIKVCDFGAGMGGRQKFPGSGARTVAFMAPEQQPSTAADVWGVGMIMACASRLEQVAERRDGGPNCTEELTRAILICLRGKPRDRVPSEHLVEMVSKTMAEANLKKLKGVLPIGPR